MDDSLKERKETVVLFSGRFDPVHPSHWISVLRLTMLHDKIKVVILDYVKRKYSAQYCQQVFLEMVNLSGLSERIEVSINTAHFAKITKEEYELYGADVYASGNMLCINHLDSLGKKVYFVDRAYDYQASLYPAPK